MAWQVGREGRTSKSCTVSNGKITYDGSYCCKRKSSAPGYGPEVRMQSGLCTQLSFWTFLL